jgi:hypothetical protein
LVVGSRFNKSCPLNSSKARTEAAVCRSIGGGRQLRHSLLYYLESTITRRIYRPRYGSVSVPSWKVKMGKKPEVGHAPRLGIALMTLRSPFSVATPDVKHTTAAVGQVSLLRIV